MDKQQQLAIIDKEQQDRLFQDFTRIKAQNAVLKKAVVDYQQKLHQAEQQSKDALLLVKKNEQALDLLRLHNQRLTKRIESMQSQMKHSSSSPFSRPFGGILGSTSSHSHSSNAASGGGGSSLMRHSQSTSAVNRSHADYQQLELTLEVTNQELRSKIEQNEYLHKLLYEQEREHEQKLKLKDMEMKEMHGQLFHFKEELTRNILISEDQQIILRRQVNELEGEKQKLNEKIIDLEKRLVKCEEARENRNEELKDNSLELNEQLASMRKQLDDQTQKITNDAEEMRKLTEKVHKLQNINDELDKARKEFEDQITESKQISSSKDTTIQEMRSLKSELEKRLEDLKLKNENLELELSKRPVELEPETVLTEEPAKKETGEIVLRLSDYWKCSDEQLNREALMKRYYEDKMRRFFQSNSNLSINNAE